MEQFDWREANVDPVQKAVEGALMNLHFPASRLDLVRYAQERHAPEETVIMLAELPDRMYHSVDDIILQVEEPQEWGGHLDF